MDWSSSVIVSHFHINAVAMHDKSLDIVQTTSGTEVVQVDLVDIVVALSFSQVVAVIVFNLEEVEAVYVTKFLAKLDTFGTVAI